MKLSGDTSASLSACESDDAGKKPQLTPPWCNDKSITPPPSPECYSLRQSETQHRNREALGRRPSSSRHFNTVKAAVATSLSPFEGSDSDEKQDHPPQYLSLQRSTTVPFSDCSFGEPPPYEPVLKRSTTVPFSGSSSSPPRGSGGPSHLLCVTFCFSQKNPQPKVLKASHVYSAVIPELYYIP